MTYPHPDEPLPEHVERQVRAVHRLLDGRKVVVLTGAGVSTESGIPDYRSPEALKKPRRPIQGPEFVTSAALRKRYWARAMAGWESFRAAQPSASHHALAALERRGRTTALITQNVDRLHHAAGSQRVIELHGALAEVVCLACGTMEDRDALQRRMRHENPRWLDGPTPMAPDGDADLDDASVAEFHEPTCVACDGALKPNVVFFGHNVARHVVDQAFACVDRAEALLVAGTSLTVFSGYRFLLRAAERRIPIAIVNRGPVRGEERATLKVEAPLGLTLATLASVDDEASRR